MRRLLPLATLSFAALLTLSGCGEGSAMYQSETESSAAPADPADGSDGSDGSESAAATDDAGGTGGAGPLDCAEPPALPSDVAQFSQDDLPAPHSGDPATVTATLETTCGDIVLELAAEAAPQTVASFEFLADQGYWDGSPCHRLTTQGIYVLQCGDPTGTGRGNPGYGYGIENAPADGLYPPGTLAMARTQDPDSNGGQFFIVYDDTQLPVQGGGYSIFGRVTAGLDIVEAIAAAGGQGGAPDGAPAQPISILSVDVG